MKREKQLCTPGLDALKRISYCLLSIISEVIIWTKAFGKIRNK